VLNVAIDINFRGHSVRRGHLIERIPMRFQRRGGRKRIVAPDGSEFALSSEPRPDGTLVKALARAWRWQRRLDDGVYGTVSEIGDAENISKSYVRCGNRAQAQPSAGGGCPSR
jgi:hypothetical protein